MAVINQLHFDPQGHRQAGSKVLEGAKKGNLSAAGAYHRQLPHNADLMPKPKRQAPADAARIQNPGVQFQPTNAMPIKRSASQTHVQRYRSIKKRVQRQMMVGEQRLRKSQVHALMQTPTISKKNAASA